MADIKVRIEVNPNRENEHLGKIQNVNAELSNVSIKVDDGIFVNEPKEETAIIGSNGLSWANTFINENGKEDSYLVFDEQGYVDNADLQGGVIESEQNPTEFVWGIVPDNKQYSVKLTFTGASNLKDIIVYGDQVANQFPTRAIIDGTTEIFSDDYRWAINLQTESDTHTIKFTHWNRANYNACLTLITVMMKYFEIDKRTGLKSVESLSQSTGQPRDIFYGMVSNSGSVQVIDVEGEIAEMVRDGVIPNSNVKIDILANGKQIQAHKTLDSEYNINGKTFSTQNTNTLSALDNYEFKEVKIPKYTINLYYPNYAINNLGQLLSIISNRYGINIDFSERIKYGFGNYVKVDNVQNYLEYIKLNNIYHSDSIATNVINEILQIAQLNLLQKDDGTFKVVSSRPILNGEETIIKIPAKNQVSNFEVDFIGKNKYNNVRYTKNSLQKEIQEALNVTYNFKDVDGNFMLGEVDGSNVQVIGNYLCLFKTVNTSNSFSRFEGSYGDSEWGESYPYSYMLNEGVNTSGSGGLITTIYNSESTIEEFDFASINEGCIRLIKYSLPNSETFAFKINLSRNVDATHLTIILRCIAYNTNSTEVLLNENDRIYELDTNSTFINADTYYVDSYSGNRKPMYDLISENIVNDYSNGIRTATISINCTDYYDVQNNKVKEWANGEILQVGDIVRVDKDNDGNSIMEYDNRQSVYWKITGRNFRYSGVPLIDLELQEIAMQKISYPTYKVQNIQTNDTTIREFSLVNNLGSIGTIYYTLDGSIPDKNSLVYKKPFMIYDTETELIITAVVIDGNAISRAVRYKVKKTSVSQTLL